MADLPLRYGHCDGYTDICFDDSGRHVLTCGTDGDVRIWDGIEDEDPQSHSLGITVSAVAFKKGIMYISTDNYSVSAYTFPEIEFDEIIAQFTSAVYHIACSKDGRYVAGGGGDFIIKMFDNTIKELTEFRGHKGPVLSLAFDPKGKYLVSSGCDGTVRIWEMSDQKCIKSLDLFKKTNDISTSSTLCRMDWSPDGEFLAIPVEKTICFYSRESWETAHVFTDKCMSETISIVTYSPYGTYVAAAALNGQMAVWDVKTKECVSRKMHEKGVVICGLKWSPSGKDLVYTDIEGQVGVYSNPFLTTSDNLELPIAHKPSQKASPFIQAEADVDKNVSDADMDGGYDDYDKDFIDDDGDLIDDIDGDNDFDIGAIKAKLEPKIFGTDEPEEPAPEVKAPEPTIQVVEAPRAPIQTAFQPSSTPISLERRFMLWNDVGIVRSYNTEEETSIDVEFHDSNVCHPLHINNTRNHTMAALSDKALLLACPKVGEHASKLECQHFGSWDSNKEWTIEMPENEEIEAIAVSENFAVCITDKRLVRLFTISGVQCDVFLISGPVVCCTARDDQLIIVYHKGSGTEKDQCLNMMHVKVKLEGHSIAKEYSVPLSSKSFLSWLGFSDEGSPCIVDTSGMVSLLIKAAGSKWTPVANSCLKEHSKTYFVIGVSEIKQEIRCILCKGTRYPSLLPRPTISVLSFSLPFCEMASDRGQLEEENRRHAMAYKCMEGLLKEGYELDSEFQEVEKKWMSILLKMFALATRNDRDVRALNVAELMPTPTIVQGAIRYATSRHKMGLAERLGEVMNNKLNQKFQSDFEEFEQRECNPSESLISTRASTSFSLSDTQETILKPKSLVRKRPAAERVETMEEDISDMSMNDSRDTIPETPDLPKAASVANPFRSSLKAQSKKEVTANPNSIDDILDSSMKSISARNSTSSEMIPQPKKSRFQIKKDLTPKAVPSSSTGKGKVGFDLYLEENRESIKETSSTDLTEQELIKTALKMFKELPKAEKQKYQKPSGSMNIKDSFSAKMKTTDNGENDSETKENAHEGSTNGIQRSPVKRKENDFNKDECEPKLKKSKSNQESLSDKTVRKLTAFAFTKTPK